MLAQSVTPAVAGLLMSGLVFNDMRFLFPYATICMIIALLVSLLIVDDKLKKES
jgi:hypothetical protein